MVSRSFSWFKILMFGIVLLLAACTQQRYAVKTIAPGNQFSEAQSTLILDADAQKPMRLYLITNQSDSVLLRQKSANVIPDSTDEILQHFVSRLHSTVTDPKSMGVGIAAPQVGILKNIIWVQRFDKPGFPFEEYLNPKILQYSEMKQTRREGCLSIPDRSDTLNCRSYAILLEYDRLNGDHKIEMVEDFTAIIFQHEIDHLNGILYIDHLEKEMKQARKKL